MRRLGSKIESDIISKYQSGLNMNQIRDSLGISTASVSRVLTRNGIDERHRRQSSSKYGTKHEFFDNIDTEEKAYILGFIFADGYVHKNGESINITVSKKDSYLLEIIRSYLFTGEPSITQVGIKTYKGYKSKPSCILILNSKRLSARLIEIGCVPNKSLILDFPSVVPNDLLGHFIRGYFDGDGSISFSSVFRQNHLELKKELRICSSDSFIKGMIGCVEELTGIKFKYTSYTRPSVASLYSNDNICSFIDFIYGTMKSNLYLTRKHDRCMSLKQLIQDDSKKKRWLQSNYKFETNGMHLILLSGGRGTRVREITHDKIPKSLISLQGRPFLDHVIESYSKFRRGKIHLSCGFLSDVIKAHINKKGLDDVVIHTEKDRLGTGGALGFVYQNELQSGRKVFGNKSHVMVANADNLLLFDQDYYKLADRFKFTKEMEEIDGFILSAFVYNQGDMGLLEVKDNTVLSFKEKKQGEGWVNLGFYILKAELISSINGAASLEKDLFPRWIDKGKVFNIIQFPIENWLEIGTPDALADAERRLK